MTERNQYVKISNLNNLKPPIRVNLDECNSRRKCGLQSAASDITQTLVLVICLFLMIIEPFLGNAGQFLCIYCFARIQQQLLKLGFRISAQSEKAFLQFLGTLPIMQSKIGPPFFLVPLLLLEKKKMLLNIKSAQKTHQQQKPLIWITVIL